MPHFLHVDVPRFQRQRLDVGAPWIGAPTLRLNGQPVRTRLGRAQVVDDRGQTVQVRVWRWLPDPLPVVRLDDHVVRFGLPWRWYEWLWMVFPLVLLKGGLVGGVAAFVVLLINGRLLRSRFSTPFRYLASLLVVLVTFGGLLDLALVVHGLLHGPQA